MDKRMKVEQARHYAGRTDREAKRDAPIGSPLYPSREQLLESLQHMVELHHEAVEIGEKLSEYLSEASVMLSSQGVRGELVVGRHQYALDSKAILSEHMGAERTKNPVCG